MAFKRPYAERSHQDDISNPHSVTAAQTGAASAISPTANSSPGYLVMTPANDETPYKSLIEVYSVNINLPRGGAYLINGDEHTHSMLYDNNTGYAAIEVSAYEDETQWFNIIAGATGNPLDIIASGIVDDIDICITPKGAGKLYYSDVEILTVAGTAADSYLLEGASAASFATADHNHDSTYATVGHTHTGMVTFSTGDGVPSSTPASIGLQYIDITNKHVYQSVGTGSSSDWIQLG